MSGTVISPELRDQHLALLREGLAHRSYPGYPEQESRLVDKVANLTRSHFLGRLVIPDGPWNVDTHANRHDTEIRPKLLTRMALDLGRAGMQLDSQSRPLHPWFKEMVEDPSIGVVTGKGAYWEWGPNPTADPIVLHRGHVLLIKRKDTGHWALPGGFLNKKEHPIAAAHRELKEETGITLPKNVKTTVVYAGALADIRVTANAWPETTAVLFEVDPETDLAMPIAQDDAVRAAWIPIEQAAHLDLVFGSHKLLLKLAMQQVQNPSKRR